MAETSNNNNNNNNNCILLTYATKVSQPPETTHEAFQSKGFPLPSKFQVLTILLGSLSYLIFGMLLSWPNTLTAHLMVDNTTLLGSHLFLSDQQLDWTGSLLYLVCSAASMPMGWLVGRHGRRPIFIAAIFPLTCAWILLAFGFNFQMIIAGRCVMGVGYAMLAVPARTYIAEISNTNIRGMALAFLDVIRGLGYVVTSGLGAILPWYHIAFLNLGVVFIFCASFIFILPESPNFLIIQGRDEEALHVLRRLRPPSDNVHEELMQIKRYNESIDSTSGYAAFLKWDIIKKVFVIFGIDVIGALSGCEVSRVNLSRMMKNSGITLDVNISSMIALSMLLFGSLTMTAVVDRVGRRACIIISLLLMSVAYTILGMVTYLTPPPTYLQLHMLEPPTNITQPIYEDIASAAATSPLMWVSLICFMAICFGIFFGVATVALTVAVEYFPTNIRAEVASLCYGVRLLLLFVSVQLYSVMIEWLTYAGLYWFYAAWCALGAVYTWAVIHETNQHAIG